jgi:hypothetical protein
MRLMRQHPSLATRANITGKSLPCFNTPEGAREAFFSEHVAEADVVRYTARLQEESQRVILDGLVLNLPNLGR